MRKYIGMVGLIGLVGAGALYVFIYAPDESAFSYIVAGEDANTVVALMGRPRHVERHSPLLRDVDYEYEYYLWPIPKVWCVGFKNNQVIKKDQLQSP